MNNNNNHNTTRHSNFHAETHTPVYVTTHPTTFGTSYLWIVKIREGCYAFDVLNSELVLGVGQWDWGY